MGTMTNNNAPAYAAGIDVRLPYMGGFQYWNFFGRDPLTGEVADPERNMILDKPRSILKGAPVVNDCSITCVGMTDYIQTLIPPQGVYTYYFLGRPVLPDSGSVPLISNGASRWPTTGAQIQGQSMYLNDVVQGDSRFRLTTVKTVNDAGAPVAVATSTQDFDASNASDMWLFVGRSYANGDVLSKVMGTGLVSVPQTNVKADALGDFLRIGSQYSSGANDPVRLCAAGIAQGEAHNDAQVQAIYDYLKPIYLRRGVTIV